MSANSAYEIKYVSNTRTFGVSIFVCTDAHQLTSHVTGTRGSEATRAARAGDHRPRIFSKFIIISTALIEVPTVVLRSIVKLVRRTLT